MQASSVSPDSYAEVIAHSKRLRWNGAMQPRLPKVLLASLGPDQVQRANDAFAPLLSAVTAEPSPVAAMA